MIPPEIFAGLKSKKPQKKAKRRKSRQRRIDDNVCECYCTNMKMLRSKSRKRSVVEPRQVNMTLRNVILKQSLTKVGQLFGKDHATVLHAKRTVKNLYQTNKIFREKLLEIITKAEFKPEEFNEEIVK